MDELLIDIGELESVEKFFTSERLNFPVIYISDRYCTFNKHCKSLLGEAVRWFTNSQYVVGLPASRSDVNAFCIATNKQHVKAAHVPSALRHEKKIQNGYYKVYKYKNGFAFKRYEQINPADYLT